MYNAKKQNIFIICDAEVGHVKVDEQQQQNLPDESVPEAATSSGLGKNLMNEDDLKASFAMESSVCQLF